MHRYCSTFFWHSYRSFIILFVSKSCPKSVERKSPRKLQSFSLSVHKAAKRQNQSKRKPLLFIWHSIKLRKKKNKQNNIVINLIFLYTTISKGKSLFMVSYVCCLLHCVSKNACSSLIWNWDEVRKSPNFLENKSLVTVIFPFCRPVLSSRLEEFNQN
jgi:hypothetical protein